MKLKLLLAVNSRYVHNFNLHITCRNTLSDTGPLLMRNYDSLTSGRGLEMEGPFTLDECEELYPDKSIHFGHITDRELTAVIVITLDTSKVTWSKYEEKVRSHNVGRKNAFDGAIGTSYFCTNDGYKKIVKLALNSVSERIDNSIDRLCNKLNKGEAGVDDLDAICVYGNNCTNTLKRLVKSVTNVTGEKLTVDKLLIYQLTDALDNISVNELVVNELIRSKIQVECNKTVSPYQEGVTLFESTNDDTFLHKKEGLECNSTVVIPYDLTAITTREKTTLKIDTRVLAGPEPASRFKFTVNLETIFSGKKGKSATTVI